jgi:hypothetical protein
VICIVRSARSEPPDDTAVPLYVPLTPSPESSWISKLPWREVVTAGPPSGRIDDDGACSADEVLATTVAADGAVGDERPHPAAAASPKTNTAEPTTERTRTFMCPPYRPLIGRSRVRGQTPDVHLHTRQGHPTAGVRPRSSVYTLPAARADALETRYDGRWFRIVVVGRDAQGLPFQPVHPALFTAR